ncbi:MAG: hypothetical protein R3C58_11075 [Parvularculaceae bacterium]
MYKNIWLGFAMGFLGFCVSAQMAHATSYAWNPVFNYVREIRISVPVRESGLEFDSNGSLVASQESKFWIRRTEIQNLAFEEASKLIKISRPDIRLYTRSFASSELPKLESVTNPYENGRRTLSLALNIKAVDDAMGQARSCYVASITATLIRGGEFGSYQKDGKPFDREAEFLSTDGGYFTEPFLACGEISEIDAQLKDNFGAVVRQVSEGLKLAKERTQ